MMLSRRGRKKAGAAAAFSLVRSNAVDSTVTSSTRSITLPTVAAGHAVVLTQILFSGNNPVTAVSDSAGGTWQSAVVRTNVNVGDLTVWYCKSHPGSASTLTVTITLTSSSGSDAAMVLAEYSKSVSAVRSTSGTDSASSSVASQSVSVTSVSGDLVVALQGRYDNAISGEGPTSPLASVNAVGGSQASNVTGWASATSTTTSCPFASTGATQMATVAASFAP